MRKIAEKSSRSSKAQKKTNVKSSNVYRDSLLAKQVEMGRMQRSVNPESVQNPAHADGHRRLNLRRSTRH